MRFSSVAGKVKTALKNNFSGADAFPRIITVAALLFLFLTTMYSDQELNLAKGLGYCWSIFDGELFKTIFSASADYGYTIYLIYMLWSLPVCIIFKIAGLGPDFRNIPFYLWYKLLLISFAMFSVYMVYKIVSSFADGKQKEACWAYSGSLLLVAPAFAICQCDVMGLCFALLGLYYYINNKTVRFLIFFAIAITMKFFALMLFIPLVILKWKSVWKLLLVLAAAITPMAVMVGIQLILPGASAKWMRGSSFYVVGDIYYGFTRIRVDINDAISSVGLFGFFYLLLCVMAYVIRLRDDENKSKYVVWFGLATYVIFFLFSGGTPYWYIIMAPYLVMAAYINRQNEVIVTILGIFFELYWLAAHSIYSSHCFMNVSNLKYLLFKERINPVKINIINYAVTALTGNEDFIEHFMPLIKGIAYASVFAILILSFPGFKNLFSQKLSDKEMRDDALSMKAVSFIRPLILTGCCILNVLAVVHGIGQGM